MVQHKRMLALFVLATGAFSVTSPSADAHPYHVSSAEVEYDESRRCLEIAIRIDALDLENAVRRLAKQPLRLESESAEKWIERYVFQRFRVETLMKEPVKLAWVGYEIDRKAAWVYFETAEITVIEGVWIINELLFGQVPRQSNHVLLRIGEQRLPMTMTERNPRAQISDVPSL